MPETRVYHGKLVGIQKYTNFVKCNIDTYIAIPIIINYNMYYCTDLSNKMKNIMYTVHVQYLKVVHVVYVLDILYMPIGCRSF